MINAYLEQLAGALRVRGAARRRFLDEIREHLTDVVSERGESGAAADFGPPADLARAFDAEVATGRAVLASWWSAAGVIVTGGSTLALIHAADPAAHAPTGWAVCFAVAAQVAVVATALALAQALRLRGAPSSPSDVALLCRRSGCALLAAAVTMFAAGAALPGTGAAGLLLTGPALACAAAAVLVRARLTVRRLEGARDWSDRSPFADLRALTGVPVPVVGPIALALLAALGAFLRDLSERGSSPGGAAVVGAIEAAAVLVAYLTLRAPLGLRTLRG